MDFFKNLEGTLDNLWQPVLKPPRRPICQDTLGFKYVSTPNESVFRRQDGVFRSPDDTLLRYTCYLKLAKEESELSRSSFTTIESFRLPNRKNPILEEINSIEGTELWYNISFIEINQGKSDWDSSIRGFLVYFHSHAANRAEGRFLLNYAAIKNYNLCLMDMRGSGQSEGEFSTLGIKESGDVYAMIKDLQRKYQCDRIVLFGRSMGAAAVLKFICERKKGRSNSQTRNCLQSKECCLTPPSIQ
jgi:hypothetical protein